MALLEIKNLSMGYGVIEVLKGISLTVNQGEIVTLIGANGAGKTSLLMSISGIHPLRGGELLFKEQRLNAPAHLRVQQGIAQVPEGRKIFPRLTVLENLELGSYLRSDAAGIAQDLERVYELFPVLKNRQAQLGGTLSGGEQQMLAIGRALMSKPTILLLDEPSMGVAPLLVAKIFETIVRLNREGLTILLVEQNANLALKTASRGYVLENGRIILDDQAEVLRSHPRVLEAYLGG